MSDKQSVQPIHPHPTQNREFLESISNHETRSKGGHAMQHDLGRHHVAVPDCPRCQREKQ
jgi:hypothetical protein